ncbi:DUF5722 domain-containing protein [uncultured Alistipes sp.]|uniref:DUF5722 domain-containing protein n=1 Tax=uncultured Alistipes sp. TaxID=538949 RepID=UPI00259B9832|nr:DUF5722 domain-containing protein [uncultured Alistipes sp.]
MGKIRKKRKLVIKTRYSKTLISHKGNEYSFMMEDTVYLPICLKQLQPISNDYTVLCFEYVCPIYVDYIGVSVANCPIKHRNIIPKDTWQSMTIDISDYINDIRYIFMHKNNIAVEIVFGQLPTSRAGKCKIRNIYLRPYTIKEQSRLQDKNIWREQGSSFRLMNYLFESEFSGEITQVRVAEAIITIFGKVNNNHRNYSICEVPIFSNLDNKNYYEVFRLPSNTQDFEISISRYTDRFNILYDRLYSRWVISTTSQDGENLLASYAHYADHVECFHDLPRPIPKGKKGIGAFRLNDYETDLDLLGISYITINCRINNFLHLSPTKYSIPFEYCGQTYYADKNQIEKYDQTVIAAYKRNIIVSAIILVYPAHMSKDEEAGHLLEHPDYNPAGNYSMPNMTNIKSMSLYAAAIDFLAARYNRADEKYGRIHNWIAHNEIDAGWIWTNAGKKDAVQLMENYIRSMRLIYYTAKKYDKQTEVFISLTNHWQAHYKEQYCFPASNIMEILMRFTSIEGDFKWGIAHHTYSQELMNPKAWEDTNATETLKTKYITIKNVKVLNQLINRKDTFYLGKHKRTLLLAEQNPNSPDYSYASQKLQAASLAYALKKIGSFSGIDAYIAHSWIDVEYEAGLRTGLRKYKNDVDDPYGEKMAWFVYKAFETSQENEAFDFAKAIIGIRSWNEIL